MIQTCIQLNDFFGCSWCDQPGVKCDGRLVHPFEEHHYLETKKKNNPKLGLQRL
jgi:hypothetical protein